MPDPLQFIFWSNGTSYTLMVRAQGSSLIVDTMRKGPLCQDTFAVIRWLEDSAQTLVKDYPIPFGVAYFALHDALCTMVKAKASS